jgi:SpoVK/Ycf46/Vps4 family AAA+-type ATPase
MPPELLRKGRTDEVFSVTLPNEEERNEIIRIHVNKRKQDASKIAGLNIAAERSAGYVPSEIEAAVKEAITEAYHKWVETGRPAGGFTITGEGIASQLADMKPLSEAFREDFQAMQTWAQNNARPASRDPFVAETGAAVSTAPAVRERSRAIGGRGAAPLRSTDMDG